jgi:hypothetical protein
MKLSLLLFINLFLFASNSLACSCELDPLFSKYDSADVVLVGNIKSYEENPGMVPNEFIVTVVESFKGINSTEVKIEDDSCTTIKVGGTFLIYSWLQEDGTVGSPITCYESEITSEQAVEEIKNLRQNRDQNN